MSDSHTITVYRAGTDKGPSFVSKHNIDDVWLITNPGLYYSLFTENPDQAIGVHLWKADIDTPNDGFVITKHPTVKGTYVAKLQPDKSIKELEELEWEICAVQSCDGGMSLMNFSALVQAVTVYLKDHRPTTPEEFNFQAELKSASHWHWPKEEKNIKPVIGPHKDRRLKTAAEQTILNWNKKLEGKKKKQCTENDQDVEDDSDEDMSDIEDSIFDLTNYFDRKDHDGIKDQEGDSSGGLLNGISSTKNKDYARGSKDATPTLGKEGIKLAEEKHAFFPSRNNVKKGRDQFWK